MKPGWTLIGLSFCAAVGVLGVIPWRMPGEANRAEIASRMSHDLAVKLRIDGPLTLKLLPRPRVQIADVTVTAPDRSIALTAPALSGELDLGALLHGRLRVTAATVSSPTGTIDIDRAEQAPPTPASGESAVPVRVTMRGGVFRLLSQRLGVDTLVTDLSGTFDASRRGDAGFSANGSAVWRGLPEQFTLQIGAPSGEAPQQSKAYLRIGSPAGSFWAEGEVSGGSEPQFTGRVAASSAAPDRLSALLGLGPSGINLHRLGLSGYAVAKRGDVSLSEAALRLNTTDFEGTLGYRTDNGRGLIQGTLATSRLDLDGFAGHAIDGTAADKIYQTRIAPPLADLDLDLRVSASEAALGGVTAQDIALALLCHDNGLEVTLDEALAFGGVLKGRFLGSLLQGDVKAHAELSLSGVDLGLLDGAMTGRERMTGVLTGEVAVDGHGQSLRDLVPTLAGTGQISVENGDFMGVSVSQALKRLTRRLPPGSDQGGQLTAFASASSSMRIVNGTVNFVDGKVTGPGMSLSFAGQGDLPHAKVDIMAIASPTDAAGVPIVGAPGLPIEMRGVWGEPLLLLERSGHLPLSTILPSLDAGQILP